MGTIPAPNIAQDAMQISEMPQNQLAEYARVAALKQQTALEQQQTQQAQTQNQIMQQQLRDQQIMTKSLQGWDGSSMDSLLDSARQNGLSAPAYLQMQQQILARRQQLQTLDKGQLDNMTAHHDAALGMIDSWKQVPDDELSQTMTNGIQQLQAQGHLSPAEANAVIQHAQSMPPDQFRPWLDTYEKGLQGEKAIITQAIQDRETTAKEQTAQAAQQKAQTEAAEFTAKLPGGSLQNPDMRELNDWLAKNPGKDSSDFLAWKAKQTPLARFQIETAAANAGAGGNAAQVAQRFGMSPEAFDRAAEVYNSTGQLPQMGRGISGIALNRALMNRAAELHPGESLAENSAQYKANQTSLSKLQTNFDQVTAFENTAGKNLDQFLATAKNVIDFGSPLINMPLRKAASMAGSGDQAAYNAARTTALTEISKVLNSSNASGVLSDSARQEVEQLIGPNASLKQIYSAAQILKQDMANRHQAYQEQIQNIQGRMGPNKTQPPSQGGGGQPQTGAFSWDNMPKHQP